MRPPLSLYSTERSQGTRGERRRSVSSFMAVSSLWITTGQNVFLGSSMLEKAPQRLCQSICLLAFSSRICLGSLSLFSSAEEKAYIAAPGVRRPRDRRGGKIIRQGHNREVRIDPNGRGKNAGIADKEIVVPVVPEPTVHHPDRRIIPRGVSLVTFVPSARKKTPFAGHTPPGKASELADVPVSPPEMGARCYLYPGFMRAPLRPQVSSTRTRVSRGETIHAPHVAEYGTKHEDNAANGSKCPCRHGEVI